MEPEVAAAIAERVLADRDQAQWARGFDDGLDVAARIIAEHLDGPFDRLCDQLGADVAAEAVRAWAGGIVREIGERHLA